MFSVAIMSDSIYRYFLFDKALRKNPGIAMTTVLSFCFGLSGSLQNGMLYLPNCPPPPSWCLVAYTFVLFLIFH